jgi:hypothetical protein
MFAPGGEFDQHNARVEDMGRRGAEDIARRRNAEPRHIDWRAEADEHERQEARGYEFPMPYTFKQPARVRRIPLADIASIGLPNEMQATVLEIFREIQAGGTFAVRQWQDLKRNQERQKQLANGLCIAGFMEPRLVETHEEAVAANDPGVVWVEKIDIRDRMAYLQTVMNPESEAAKAMAPFPETGASGAESGEAVPELRGEPIQPTPTPRGDGLRVADVSAVR